MPNIAAWLQHAVSVGASDLHLVPGYRPTLRLHGDLQPLDAPEQDAESLRPALLALCPESSRTALESGKNADFAVELVLDAKPRRFRTNYFLAGRALGCLFSRDS